MKGHFSRHLSLIALAGVMLGGAPPMASATSPGDDFAAAAAAAFAEADADGDGELAIEEFASFHQLMRDKLDALRFAQLDADGSGGLTEAELEAGRPGGRGGPPPF